MRGVQCDLSHSWDKRRLFVRSRDMDIPTETRAPLRMTGAHPLKWSLSRTPGVTQKIGTPNLIRRASFPLIARNVASLDITGGGNLRLQGLRSAEISER